MLRTKYHQPLMLLGIALDRMKHFAKHPAIRAAALAAIVKLESEHARKVKDASQAPPGVRFDKEEKAA